MVIKFILGAALIVYIAAIITQLSILVAISCYLVTGLAPSIALWKETRHLPSVIFVNIFVWLAAYGHMSYEHL